MPCSAHVASRPPCRWEPQPSGRFIQQGGSTSPDIPALSVNSAPGCNGEAQELAPGLSQPHQGGQKGAGGLWWLLGSPMGKPGMALHAQTAAEIILRTSSQHYYCNFPSAFQILPTCAFPRSGHEEAAQSRTRRRKEMAMPRKTNANGNSKEGKRRRCPFCCSVLPGATCGSAASCPFVSRTVKAFLTSIFSFLGLASSCLTKWICTEQ